ncbi:transcriptional regulator ATRX isoform X2 [Salvelinus alpinus]|uniref:transcriptional regulator ATRX isoform X2 n=2 Tax=Salvelinus alpinus TaxID=8036 RepID=UPI0039FD4CC5
MSSPEDSSSSSTQKTSFWADQQTATPQLGVSLPSPTHCFGDGERTSSANPAETPISTNPATPSETPVSTNPSSPSQTPVSPQKKRTAEKGTFDASQPQGERRKRGRPRKHKTLQTDTEHHIHQAQSLTATHPCLQPEDQTEAVTLTPVLPVIPEDRCQSPDAQTKVETQLQSPSSPVPEDKCQSPEATFEPPCPTLDLQSANKGQSKKWPHLSSASVGQGDLTGHNVLTTGGYTNSQARGMGAEPSQNDSITATGIFLSKCAKEQRTLCQSPQNLKDGRKAAKKSLTHKVDQPQESEAVTNGEKTSKPLPTIKVGQENCLTQKTGRKRKYTKKSQSHKVDQPSDTDQSQQSETVRNGKKTSIKSPTHKIDWSQETVRKRTYTKKSQTPKVDQSQEESVKKEGSKISPTHKGEQSQEMVIKRKYTKKSQTPKVDQSQEESVKKESSKISPTHKGEQSQEMVIKRKYTKKSQTPKVDQSQEESVKKEGSKISPTHKGEQSQEMVIKRKYTKKSQTPKVDQSQEESVKKEGSKISPTHKGEQSQEMVIKRKYTKKTQSHKGDKPQETVRNGKKTTMKSPTHQVDQSQEFVTKRKKVSKISSTHKVDHSQETVKKRKYTKKSQTQETDQSQEETGKNASMKSLTNKVNKVASKKSQSHTVEQSLGIDQSQETVRKRNYTKKSQRHKEDSHETVRNGEKTSKKSQKHKVELRDTEQSQEETVKNRKYTKKSKTHKVDSGVLSLLPVLSADLSLNLSSPTCSPPALPKRKYTKKLKTLKVDSDVPSSLIVLSADLSSSLQSSLSPTLSPSGIPFSPNTPKRVRGRPRRVQQQLFLSSTPGPHPGSSTGTDNPFSASLSHLGLGSKTEGPQNASPITPWKLLELSPLEKTHLALPGSKPRGRPRVRPRKNSATVKGVKKKVKPAAEKRSQTFSSEEGPPAKLRRRSRRGQTEEGAGLQSGDTTSTEPLQRCRPRFELQESDSPDEDTGDASLSSDLSIELSVQEDRVTSLTLEEEEEQDDEEDLPSFLNNTKPLSITEGICVWCKFRNYPFWPAMVKSVNRKLKKASIVFIDDLLFDKKRIRKGFSVSLKTLKPFDCEEADQLVCKAREKYDAAIKWCLALIADYRIRIGCGFTGSFIEYFSDDISCPVRRCYPRGTSDLTFPSKLILEEQYVTSDPEGDDQEGSKRQEEERRRKLLPDRSKAARNRANEKLVDFVVRQRRVETRLLGVISGQQQSKWLRWFLAASRSVVDTYLEDEEQLDQVYQYLRGVYETAPLTAPCLADVDRIRLVLDVLLPEAIIYAIAGVDELSLVKAEDKYLKGPCLSKREREEFDAMIEQQMKMKASIRQRPAH